MGSLKTDRNTIIKMVDLVRCLPTKVFCCLQMHPGAMILMSLIILFRFIAMIVGCFYGPYLYLVLPLGGLYLAADVLLLYTIFGSGLKSLKQEDENSDSPEDPTVSCDFKTQKVWIFIWLAMNVLALIGLLASIGLFGNLGWWSMTHEPLHVGVFFMILLLLTLLIYGHLIVVTVYLVLKDAWIRGILGNNVNDEEMAGLTHGGKRIYA